MNWKRRASIGALIGVTFVLAWSGQRLLLADPPLATGGVVMLAAAAVLFLVLSVWSHYDEDPASTPRLFDNLKNLLQHALPAVLLMVGGVVCGAAATYMHTQTSMLPWPALATWWASMTLFLVGAWLIGTPPPLPEHEGSAPIAEGGCREPFGKVEILLLLALTGMAFLLRQIAVGDIPNNLSADEAEMGMVARDVVRGRVADPFGTSWLAHPNLWFYTQALGIKLFGDSVGGLRMASVFFGTATIPVLYLFARPLYGRLTAATGAALLAAYHFHLHYSRYALNNIADPLLGLAAFAALFHGWRTARPFSFALAGVMLGMAMHFYMGSRLLLVLVMGVLAHQVLFNRAYLLRLRWHLALLAVGFVVGFGPLLHHFITHPETFSSRFDAVGISSDWFQRVTPGDTLIEVLTHQSTRAFGAFTFVPDTSCQYDPGIPLLDRVSSLLFVVGLVLAVWRWRSPAHILLPAWVAGAAFFGGVILSLPPESGRYVTTAPALCLLIALAVSWVGQVVQGKLALPRVAAIYGIGGAIMAFLVAWNLHFYFLVFTPRDNFGWTEVSNEIGHYLNRQSEQLSEDIYVYFMGAPRIYLNHGPIRYFAPGVAGVDVHTPIISAGDIPPLPDDHWPVFVFLPERKKELEVIRARYPDGVLYTLPDTEYKGRGDTGLLFLGYTPGSQQGGHANPGNGTSK